MFPRPDTGNFNRFLTSMGLLLLLAALLLPYFFFRDTGTLRITSQELDRLTPVAKQALESRQRRSHDLEVPVLVFAGALVIGGAWILLLGGRRLRVAQGKEDEEIDRKAKKENFEIRQMSQKDVAEKREEQAREIADEDEGGGLAAESKKERAPVEAPPVPRTSSATQVQRLSLAQSRTAIARIEAELRASLEKEELAEHDFLYEVEMVRPGRHLQLDGLFRAVPPNGTDVVLETKVSRQARFLGGAQGRQFADATLSLVARYQAISEKEATGWLLIVVPEEVEDLNLEDRRRVEDRLNSRLAGLAKATIIAEREIDSLPERFDALFGPQAK
jgi:LPXTG cell wall anchor motif